MIAESTERLHARIVPVLVELSQINFLDKMLDSLSCAACYSLLEPTYAIDIYPVSLNANISDDTQVQCVKLIDKDMTRSLLQHEHIWEMFRNDVAEKARSQLTYALVRTNALRVLDRSLPRAWLQYKQSDEDMERPICCTWPNCERRFKTWVDAEEHWVRVHKNKRQESVEQGTLRAMRNAFHDGNCFTLRDAVDEKEDELIGALEAGIVCEEVVQCYQDKWQSRVDTQQDLARTMQLNAA